MSEIAQENRAPHIGQLPRTFSAPGVPVDQLDLAPLGGIPFSAAWFAVEPKCVSAPHEHHDRECWVVSSGRGFVEYEGRSVPLAPGDAVLLEPDRPHSARCDGDVPLVVFSIWW